MDDPRDPLWNLELDEAVALIERKTCKHVPSGLLVSAGDLEAVELFPGCYELHGKYVDSCYFCGEPIEDEDIDDVDFG